MKKHIIKVVLITMLCLFGAVILLVGSLKLFAPRTMAEFYDSIGEETRAVNYAAQAYKKDASIDNLVLVSNYSIKAKSDELIVKYTKELLDSEDFLPYTAKIARGEQFYDFSASSYVLAMYRISNSTDEALVSLAFGYSSEYRTSNALSSLLHQAALDGDRELMTCGLDKLESFELSGKCPSSALPLLEIDIAAINGILK